MSLDILIVCIGGGIWDPFLWQEEHAKFKEDWNHLVESRHTQKNTKVFFASAIHLGRPRKFINPLARLNFEIQNKQNHIEFPSYSGTWPNFILMKIRPTVKLIYI